jgi:RNA polymerase sigma factor (sigma-70 family)
MATWLRHACLNPCNLHERCRGLHGEQWRQNRMKFCAQRALSQRPPTRTAVRHRYVIPVLRCMAEAKPAETDADLLNRFANRRDRDAFAALVQRHGRLVWAVCHHLAGPDADDAFQATFLVLLRNVGRIRNPNSLSAWLHGVAYRVCAKSRLAAKRRAGREQAAAVIDRTNSVVPDSAWDRALAAVHEEVVKLPETLRVPFVLCALEGRSVTEAAGRLGWKVNTLSARLGRAKDAILARLNARGLTVGSAVALACAADSAPTAVAARAADLSRGGVKIPGSIHLLTQGVVGMSAYQFKLLAAGVMLILGLGVGGGTGWMTTAGAQGPGPYMPKLTPEERVKQLEAQLEQAKRDVAAKREAESLAAKGAGYATAKWHYSFVPVSEMDAERFVKLLQEREARGWEYTGQTALKKDGNDAPVWVFRRPMEPRTGATPQSGGYYSGQTNYEGRSKYFPGPGNATPRPEDRRPDTNGGDPDSDGATPPSNNKPANDHPGGN